MRQADFGDEADQFQRCLTTALGMRKHVRNATDARAAAVTTTKATVWVARASHEVATRTPSLCD
jgi:hypothetical protein